MPDKLKDILSGLSTEIDQETLLLYLQEKLSEEKKHEIEKKIMESEFTDDAVEGLQQFRNKKHLSLVIDQLNHELRKKLHKKKRKELFHIKEEPWLYFAILIIIILIIISYVVIHKYMQQQ